MECIGKRVRGAQCWKLESLASTAASRSRAPRPLCFPLPQSLSPSLSPPKMGDAVPLSSPITLSMPSLSCPCLSDNFCSYVRRDLCLIRYFWQWVLGVTEVIRSFLASSCQAAALQTTCIMSSNILHGFQSITPELSSQSQRKVGALPTSEKFYMRMTSIGYRLPLNRHSAEHIYNANAGGTRALLAFHPACRNPVACR